MKKIVIKQYSKKPCGSTIGAFEYHYGVNYNGSYNYSIVTTAESIMYMIEALRKGNEVEFIEAKEQ